MAPSEPEYHESLQGLGPREIGVVLMDNEADALLAVLETAINSGITPGIGLLKEDAEAAGFKIVAQRFRDNDPYNRGARITAVRYRSPNPDWRPV